MEERPLEETRTVNAAGSSERSHRKGDDADCRMERLERARSDSPMYARTANALEVPQGAAVHPVCPPDDVTARHGTGSFRNEMVKVESPSAV